MLVYWLFDFVSFPEECWILTWQSCCSSYWLFCCPVFCPSNSTKPTFPEIPFLSLLLGHHCNLLKCPSLHYSLKRTSGETAKTTAEATLFASLLSETQACAFLVRCLKTVVLCTFPGFLAMYSGRAIPTTHHGFKQRWVLQFGKYKFFEKILRLLWLICMITIHFWCLIYCVCLVHFHIFHLFIHSFLVHFRSSLTSLFPSAFGITCSFQFLIFHLFPC